jgi:flagellin
VDKADLTCRSLGLVGLAEVAATTGTYVPTLASDTSAFVFNSASTSQTITVNFDGHALGVTFTANQTMTLAEFKTALNTASDAVHSGWSVASTPGERLTLTGYANGSPTDVSVTNTAIEFSGGTHVAATGDFTTLTQGEANPDIAAADGSAIGVVEAAIRTKDEYRAKLGYWMNRLEYASGVLDVQAENLLTAESRISDVDVATEMSAMTRDQVLAQAGVSMLAQANSMPQMALKLLQA